MIQDETGNAGVEVRMIDEKKGKGLFATKAYKAGDTIFEEEPVVCCQFSWNAAYGYAACDLCMRPLESAEENVRRLTGSSDVILPFPECCPVKKDNHRQCDACGVKYCSAECQMKAWELHHKTLCLQSHARNPSAPLVQLEEAWKQMHYPPETSSIMLIARMIGSVKQAQQPDNSFNSFLQFCHRARNEEEEIAHTLLGEQFEGQLAILRELLGIAVRDQTCRPWLTPDGFQSLVALVGTNGQGVGTSPFSVWVDAVTTLSLPPDEEQALNALIDKLYDDMDTAVGSFLNNEGSALYTLQSRCNHSCSPNAVVAFPHSCSTLALRALTDISIGTEVCTSYLEQCELERSRHSRNKQLRKDYLFMCECPKCLAQAGDSDITSEEEDSDMEC